MTVAETEGAEKPGWTERWGEKRNKRRQERYQDDPDYRRRHTEQSRKSYRASRGVELSSCLRYIPMAASFGKERAVTFIGEDAVHTRLCFTMTEFAMLLGDYTVPVIYRWRARKLLPAPIAVANVWVETSGRGGSYWTKQEVYLYEEVVAMMQPIGQHQSQVRYYRVTDTATIEAVHAAVQQARDKL